MEEYKIYRVGNYFRIENVHTKEIFNGASKEVFVDASNTGKSEYRFFNVKNWKEIKSLKLNQIKKQDSTTYTLGEWESFYTDNTVVIGIDSSSDVLLQQIVDNTTLTNVKLNSVIAEELLQTEYLEQIKLNTTEVPVANWQISGSGSVIIPANSQRAISIKAVTDLVVTIDGVTVTWLEGEIITYGDGDGVLLNTIEIISGDWHIVGDGTSVNVIVYNFNITADWSAGDTSYPVTDQTSFELFLSQRAYNDTNNLTNIVITDFTLIGNNLQCNLTADGTILDIGGMQVTEVLGCGNLSGLQYLILSSNHIVTFNPTIPLPSSLQYLDLGSNQIVTFNPTIALPTSLQYLYLYINQIVTFNPTIALPTSLQYLDLSSNQIVTFNPTIALPSSLQYLVLDNNQIVTFNPTIPLPSSLQYLGLGNNQIVTFNPTIALPSSLQSLYLYSNQIVNFNPTIALPSSLQYLDLGSNQIVTFNPTIALPTSLQYLYLNSNQMTLAGYTASEPWANSLPIATGKTVNFNNNLASASGTNLRSILISKGWTVSV